MFTAMTAATPHAYGSAYMPAATESLSAVTRLIADARGNVPQAINRLFELLYSELYLVARKRAQDGEYLDLSATSLLHEAYLRFVQLGELKVNCRQQFFAYAASVMRSIVVDMVRAKATGRRGGGKVDVALDTLAEEHIGLPMDDTLLQINQALEQLHEVDPRLAQLVELRYFAGLDIPATAAALEVSERTVRRDWVKARSLLVGLLAA